MRDPNEYQSLDELFRNTFDNLPASPAASSWDKPSESVWQHVQQQIKPAKGWSAKGWTLLAAFFVTVSLGLYFYSNRSQNIQPATPVQETITVSPAAPVVPAPSVITTQESVAQTETASTKTRVRAAESRNGTSLKSQKQVLKQTEQAVYNSTQRAVQRQLPAGNQPLPGSHSKPPNTPLKLGGGKQNGLVAPLPLPAPHRINVPDIKPFIQKINDLSVDKD